MREESAVNESVLRRAVLSWVRGLLLTSLACVLALPFFRRFGSGSVFAVASRNAMDAAGILRLRIESLVPSVLYCGVALLSGMTVFCRPFLRGLCVLRGVSFGAVLGMIADGRLLLSHPVPVLIFSLAELFFWLAEGTAVGIFSDELFAGYAQGDVLRFRRALGGGLSSALALSGCAFLASAAGSLAGLFS